MFAKGTKKDTVKFTAKVAAQTKSAALAGDFNGWKPVAMKRGKDGAFSVTVAVPKGRHEYKFILDGDWVHDPDVAEVVTNRYGTFNSVLIAE
jgi:5'-AMP-activated protein kinase regulatory beta subunit